VIVLFPLQAQTEEGLRETFNNVQRAIQEKDLDGFLKFWDEGAILYVRNELYPIDRADYIGDGFRNLVSEWFDLVYSAGFTRVNVDYRVFGDTGILWGEGRFATDRRDGMGSDQDRRLTVVFRWVNNTWKIVLWNGSPPPVGLNP
jgi:ketosteroid isomerase-like protein